KPDGRRKPATPGAHLARSFSARAARRSSASPTRKRRMVRFHPRAREPPFRGWDAALRTLTARVQVLPAVPHDTRVAVWDQPGLQNRAGGVRSLGNLRFASVAQRIERQNRFLIPRPVPGRREIVTPLVMGATDSILPRLHTFYGRHDHRM